MSGAMLATAGSLDRLLGLSRLSWSDSSAIIGWRYPLPAWAWALIVLASLLLAGWSYSRLLGPRPARMALAGARALLLMLLAVLLAGPMLVVPQERVDPDWLLVLVDRSASMGIRDVQRGDDLVSRDEALRDALRQQGQVFDEQRLGRERRIVWLGFDAGTYQIDPLLPGVPGVPEAGEPPPPQGQITAIRTAIDQALQRAAGHPVSGIVLLSDGRTHEATGTELAARLKQQAVSVFAVPLGAQGAALDLAVAEIDAPDRAFTNDVVPVTVWLDRYPADAAVDLSRLKVRLVDTVSGNTLDERVPSGRDLSDPVRLSTRSAAVGPVTWRVEVDYDPPPGGLPDLVTQNNSRELALELVDRPIRVLYVEGYPRWEYRYLKSLLVREKSIQSSVMLISADRSFAQEGTLPITRLPRDAEEFKPYDVIIIGDVPSGYFSAEQLGLIQDHVATRGAGLLWIGGDKSMPVSYDGTTLAALLPMLRPATVDRVTSATPVLVKPAPLAEALSVLSLRGPADREDGPETWPAHLPGLMWMQRLDRLRPGAEVLAAAYSDGGTLGPLITRMRYGAGQSLYIATDETWRWRYGRGELYFEQFWTQLIRMLGRGRLADDQQRARLEVSHRRVQMDEAVVVTLRIDDPLLMRRNLPRVAVAVRVPEGSSQRQVDRLELLLKPLPGGGASGSEGEGAETAHYEAIWRPRASGRLSLRVVEAALDDLDITQEIEVIRADDEMRQPAPDHARLAALAEGTQGAVIALDQLDALERLVPNRARRTPNDISEPISNSFLALGLILVLLTAEWIGRKFVRLV